jgi:hypothetical protein
MSQGTATATTTAVPSGTTIRGAEFRECSDAPDARLICLASLSTFSIPFS